MKQESTFQRLWRLQSETPEERLVRIEFEKRQREILDSFRPYDNNPFNKAREDKT